MLTKNSERKNKNTTGNNVNSLLLLQTYQKSVNKDISVGRENAVELKLKISILQFLRKLCDISEKVDGYLRDCVSVCAWHTLPLLSQYEVSTVTVKCNVDINCIG